MSRIPVAILAPLAFCALASAQLTVPSPSYPTIQSAIAAAPPNATIQVLPGTYNENIDLLGKALTLRSLAGPAFTTIDGGGTAPTVKMTTGEQRTTVVEGFTIRNGLNTSTSPVSNGGGMNLVAASPTVRNCWFFANTGAGYGGGLGGAPTLTAPCEPLVEDCRFEHNLAQGAGYASGAGLAIVGPGPTFMAGRPEVRRCTFRNNVATQRGGGAYFAYHQNAIVEDCVFSGNRTNATGTGLEGGAGLFISLNAVCIVRNNRIHNNSSGGNGGGIKFFNVTDVHLVNNTIVDNVNGGLAGFANAGAFGINVRALVTNCILWNNGGTEIAFTGMDQGQQPPTATVTYSDVQGGWTGTGNINANPSLANPASGNHRLLPGSPCFDAGNNAAANVPPRDFEGDTRPIGARVDIGADEWNPAAVLLYADRGTISVANPGTVNLTILGSSSRAGATYGILMGFSGTRPGVDILGRHLPLNVDPAFAFGISVFPSFVGTLNASGTANATMPLGSQPLSQGLIGYEMSLAAAILRPGVLDAFSNDENLVFVQ
jgi:hypothetical protein